MEKTKMTNVKALQYVAENCELPTDVAEKIGNILATYEKKSAPTADRKPTEKQIADAATMEAVGAWMLAENVKYTAGEIFKHCPHCAEMTSVQRLTPMLTKLVEANKVAKEVIKGRTYYTAKP